MESGKKISQDPVACFLREYISNSVCDNSVRTPKKLEFFQGKEETVSSETTTPGKMVCNVLYYVMPDYIYLDIDYSITAAGIIQSIVDQASFNSCLD